MHITVEQEWVCKSIINKGSALNMCLVIIIVQLGVDKLFIRESEIMVRAFDGSKSVGMGEVDPG